MTDTEQRFALSMRQADDDEPGLIRERDGTVWLVNPDGTRTQLGGESGGSQPLHGWHAYWDAFPGSWTITSELGWNTNTYEPTAVDFDTDGFADAGSLPFFAPKIPVGLGGLYKGLLTAQYIQGATGGYVSGNIGSGIGFNAAPCLFDDGTAMIYSLGDVAVLNDGANDWDFANVLNFSVHDVMILRVDFWGIRLGPLPA